MSKTMELDRGNDKSAIYSRYGQVMPAESFTFQSVNLNPENKYKSNMEKKSLSKPKSKIKIKRR